MPFHGINAGSNPARDILFKVSLIAQLVERIAVNYKVIGSNPIQRACVNLYGGIGRHGNFKN